MRSFIQNIVVNPRKMKLPEIKNRKYSFEIQIALQAREDITDILRLVFACLLFQDGLHQM